jgi:predicted regulator of Ras-like GTPase activity (Roadblock/LC7/MglB family)
MAMRDVLREITTGVEGVLCAAVVRLDGAPVDLYMVDGALKLDKVASDLGVLTKVSAYTARKMNAGPLEYCVLSAEKFVLVLSSVEVDYALVIGLRQGGNLGKARLQMKKNMQKVAAHLRQLVP